MIPQIPSSSTWATPIIKNKKIKKYTNHSVSTLAQAAQEYMHRYLVTLIIAGQTQLEPRHQWSPISAARY